MDMDEQRLADALLAATTDVPPPSFDHADVVRSSRRITMRRRSALAGGALAVLAVVGVGVAGGLTDGGRGEIASSAAAPAPAREAPAGTASPDADAAPAPREAQPPSGPIADAQAAPAAAPPLGPGDPDGCADRQDPALRAIVEQVLPEVIGAPAAATSLECRPGGERGMYVELSGGVLGVAYLPPGTPPHRVDASGPTSTEPTASGGTVTVSLTPASATPGLDDNRIAQAAAYIAPRL